MLVLVSGSVEGMVLGADDAYSFQSFDMLATLSMHTVNELRLGMLGVRPGF